MAGKRCMQSSLHSRSRRRGARSRLMPPSMPMARGNEAESLSDWDAQLAAGGLLAAGSQDSRKLFDIETSRSGDAESRVSNRPEPLRGLHGESDRRLA